MIVINDVSKILNTFLDLGEKRISRTGKKMILGNQYKNEVLKIVEYMANSKKYTERGGNKNKGILLRGPVGSGKSTIFKIIEDFEVKKKMKTAKFVSASFVVSQYNLSKQKEMVINKYSNEIYCFDDLGREPLGSNFGKEDIFVRILENRYRNFCNNGLRTHIITNLTITQIKERYGFHIEDRFYEMFNMHELKNTSFR
ncbi:hypothetical protein MED134_08521 [Dokdonia sp. MED134]|nr:hypothetical protein MED134_08521 [Dokdonia sp. MED134]